MPVNSEFHSQEPEKNGSPGDNLSMVYERGRYSNDSGEICIQIYCFERGRERTRKGIEDRTGEKEEMERHGGGREETNE